MTVNVPTETKVKVAGAFSFLGSTVVLAVLSLVSDANLVSTLPDWLSTAIGAAVTSLVTFATAWNAKHTPRPDLGQR